jgi:hypothetical protein
MKQTIQPTNYKNSKMSTGQQRLPGEHPDTGAPAGSCTRQRNQKSYTAAPTIIAHHFQSTKLNRVPYGVQIPKHHIA